MDRLPERRFRLVPVLASVDALREKKENERFRLMRQAGLLTTIPILLAVSPIIGFFIGRFLDGKLNTEPILSIVFLILGFIAGGQQVARVIRIANRDPGSKDDNDGS